MAKNRNPLGLPPSRETIGERMRTHGHTSGRFRSRTYSSWVNMRNRCENPKIPKYQRYGARGIKVCDRWQSFENFLADMGECPPKLTLDRIDNDGDYEPGNCRWATASEQRRNQPRNRRVACSDGRIFRTAIEAAEAVGGKKWGIADAVRKRQRGYKGFEWSWVDE